MRKYLWPMILIGKLLITRSKFIENSFRFLGFFSPGDPRNITRTKDIFLSHFKATKYIRLEEIRNVMELGPGQGDYSMISAIKLHIENFVMIDRLPLKYTFRDIDNDNLKHIDRNNLKLLNAKIRNNQYRYYDMGLKSFQSLKIKEFDFIYSNSVLQHVYLEEVDILIREFSRISKIGGIHSHHIDFKDCFSGGLNNLRFPKWLWETNLIKNGGFYTNRLRLSQWVKRFEKNGFKILKLEKYPFPSSVISKDNVSQDLRDNISLEDLQLSGARLILSKC